MKFQFINAEKSNYSVKLMCKVLQLSRPGNYAWKARSPSAKSLRDEALTERIKPQAQSAGERLWQSVNYEEVYLLAYDTVADAKQSLGEYFKFYNTERRHQSLGNQTPDTVYTETEDTKAA